MENKLLNVKNDFPVLQNNQNLIYLDTGATSLKPKCVIDKLNEYYNIYGVNVNRGVYDLSYKATAEYEETRVLTAKFINSKVNEVVFTRGASNGLNMVANLKYVDLDNEGRITVENFKKVLSNKTKVVALTYVSNVMGYITPIKEIIKLAHEVGAVVVVDAAQAVPHMRVDVKDLDCDFLASSAHKMMGPTGFGILYGKQKLLNKMNPIEFGGDMNDNVELFDVTYKDAPYKFETGTPSIAEAIAFKEAIKFIENIGYENIQKHEKALLDYAMNKLKEIDGLDIYNVTTETGIIAFNVKGIHPHDVATIYDENNIALRAGHHCAQLITKWLGCLGTLRATIYIYNDYQDIDKFIEVTKQAAEYFKEWV